MRGWELPERVLRLTLPSHLYGPDDLVHMDLRVATDADAIVGVLALEPTRETPDGTPGLLLHGIHVDPDHQRTGTGRALVAAAHEQVRAEAACGLLVKAQRQARGFFEHLGFRLLPVEDSARDYPYRYWQPADGFPQS